MSKEVLKMISDAMTEMNLNYEFMEWTSEVVYPYFTGEYQETDPSTEDGLQDATFILNGFSRTSWLALENAKEEIEEYFSKISGKTAITTNGNGVAAFYSSALVVPTGDAELKRIQINLTIKEWSVN